MANPFNELRSMRDNARLTESERMSILSHIRTQSTASPYSGITLFARRATSFAMMILLTGGIGMTAAADNSLPGTFLYPVKTSFTEPLQEALKVTPEAKINWKITQTERRFTEASTLAQSGELTPEIEEMLSESISHHVEEATILADASYDDVSKKLEVSATLKSVIEVEATKLETITENYESSTPTEATVLATTTADITETSTATTMSVEATAELVSTPDTTSGIASGIGSLLATADTLVAQITQQQEDHIDAIAQVDPAQAANLEADLHQAEYELLKTQVNETLDKARTALATYALVVPKPVETATIDTPAEVSLFATTTAVEPISEIATTATTSEVDTTITTVPVTENITPTPSPISQLETLTLALKTQEGIITELMNQSATKQKVEELKLNISWLNDYISGIQKQIDAEMTKPVEEAPLVPNTTSEQPTTQEVVPTKDQSVTQTAIDVIERKILQNYQ